MATPPLGTAPALIRAGSTAFLEVQCFDLTQETEPLLDPSGGVTVTIKRPDGTVYTGPGFLTRLSAGVYGLNQQTRTTDPPGTFHRRIHRGLGQRHLAPHFAPSRRPALQARGVTIGW